MDLMSTGEVPPQEADEDDELDPRIHFELDQLNLTSESINKLENELDEARTKYRMTFEETSSKMTTVAKKSKKSIKRAREYYELKEQAQNAQAESLKAARQYQSAISVYRAAKETVMVAEERLAQKGEIQLSSAWQEMLNHATIRVMEAETEKRRSEEQHMLMTSRCANLEQQIVFQEKKFKSSIAKAGPYFELKKQLEIRLQQLKQNVSDLQDAIRIAKIKYSATLKTLESISERIHESRREKIMLMFPRQPGVGAEYNSVSSSMSELTLDSLYGSIPGESHDSDEDSETWDPKDLSSDPLARKEHSATIQQSESAGCLEKEDILTLDKVHLGDKPAHRDCSDKPLHEEQTSVNDDHISKAPFTSTYLSNNDIDMTKNTDHVTIPGLSDGSFDDDIALMECDPKGEVLVKPLKDGIDTEVKVEHCTVTNEQEASIIGTKS